MKGIFDRIEIIDRFVKNQQELISSGNNGSMDKLRSQCQIQKQNNIQAKNLAKSQLQEHQLKYWQIDELVNLLNDKNNVLQQNESKDSRKLQYQLIKESSKKMQKCTAFAFSKYGNFLIVACWNEIITYQFKNSYMVKIIQRLTNHIDEVNCLYFMKQFNLFVSGSADRSIIIWEYDITGQWTVKTELKGHMNSVLCILMNKNEDMLVSVSLDKTLKFWRNVNNRLISCGLQPFIQVIQLLSLDSWSIVQKIEVDERGSRLSFLKGNYFYILTQNKRFSRIFQRYRLIQIQSCEACDILFPIQFINHLTIVSVKHGKFLNIFKVNDYNNLILIQTIEFEHRCLFGCCIDDGEYLIT